MSPMVATHDQAPAMSAEAVTGCSHPKNASTLGRTANPDMVGHTGSIPATIEAVETVDRCLGRLLESASQGYGNCYCRPRQRRIYDR